MFFEDWSKRKPDKSGNKTLDQRFGANLQKQFFCWILHQICYFFAFFRLFSTKVLKMTTPVFSKFDASSFWQYSTFHTDTLWSTRSLVEIHNNHYKVTYSTFIKITKKQECSKVFQVKFLIYFLTTSNCLKLFSIKRREYWTGKYWKPISESEV